MINIRLADKEKDKDKILWGAKEFALEVNNKDLIPDVNSKEFEEAILYFLNMQTVGVLLAEDEDKCYGGLGYFISPYVWDKNKICMEEIFWWCAVGSPPSIAMKLLMTAKNLAKKSGCKIMTLHCLPSSPEGVDKAYRFLGGNMSQLTYYMVL